MNRNLLSSHFHTILASMILGLCTNCFKHCQHSVLTLTPSILLPHSAVPSSTNNIVFTEYFFQNTCLKKDKMNFSSNYSAFLHYNFVYLLNYFSESFICYWEKHYFITHKKRENSKVILPFEWKVFSSIPWLAVKKNEVCDNIT